MKIDYSKSQNRLLLSISNNIKGKNFNLEFHLIYILKVIKYYVRGKNIFKERGEVLIMENVLQFLKDAKVYYLGKVEGDQPKIKPFGTVCMFEDSKESFIQEFFLSQNI